MQTVLGGDVDRRQWFEERKDTERTEHDIPPSIYGMSGRRRGGVVVVAVVCVCVISFSAN